MSTFIRLTDYKSSDAKEEGFFKPENRYEAKQEDFAKIPGSPVAYWVSDRVKKVFRDFEKISDIGQTREGLTTGDNDTFMRYWHEVTINNIGLNISDRKIAKESKKKWFPYNKGGEFSKWYANAEFVVDWENDGNVLQSRLHPSGRVWAHNFNLDYIFKPHISWTAISNRGLGFRYFPEGFLFDANGLGLFTFDDKDTLILLGLLNTKNAEFLIEIINSSMKFNAGDIAKLPIILPKSDEIQQKVKTMTQQNIAISKEEWDSRETSWDFKENGLLRFAREIASTSSRNDGGGVRNDGMDGKIESAYNTYCNYWREKFTTLHANEEELNRLFIDIYELGDELTPHVELKDITILKQESDIVDGKLVFDADEIMKQFVSYGVGVMFGRYSLDKEGLWIANLGQYEEWIASSQAPRNDGGVSFAIDDDNVIPVLEDDYFSDDIASRVVHFVKVVFGQENLSANIAFIEKCLGKTIRAYMVKDFYEDHIRRYKKRPIYWMVASPKKGFMSLSYMHRYKSDLFALVQNNYLREYIAKLEATKEILNQTILSESANSKDKKEADKRIKAIDVKLKELFVFDRDVLTHFAQQRVEIDLDDGVKVNYCKFSEVLYEIKGLC